MRNVMVSAVLVAGVVSACMSPDSKDTCKSDNDCAQGQTCDQAQRICTEVTGGANDVGTIGDAASDSGADTGVSDAGVGFDAGDSGPGGDTVDASTDSGVDATIEDSGPDATTPLDAGFDVGLEDVTVGDDASAEDGSGGDAGEKDVGETDGGEPDGGVADAGDVDAGCQPVCNGKCGSSDTCGGTCPDDCIAPQTCGGGGTPNECGCSQETDSEFCVRLTMSCGTVSSDDNCGIARTVDCGSCSLFVNSYCRNGTCDCAKNSCTSLNRACGNGYDDGCGGTLGCGTCSTCKNVCDAGQCVATHHSASACSSGDVYWFDSCNAKEEVKQDCAGSEVCFNSSCCTPVCAGKCGGDSNGCGGTCPDPCNGHGTCNAGSCSCDSGYAAPDCGSCTVSFAGYPVCVHCGNLNEPCCVGDICDGANFCNVGTCLACTTIAKCGSDCQVCPVDPNGTPACAGNSVPAASSCSLACNGGFYLENGNCLAKKNSGDICTADIECSSDHCRDDGWDGVGRFCAADATTCVHDGQNYANGWELCSGNSWNKSCGSGSWGSQENCAAPAFCDAGGGSQSGYKAAETCTSGGIAGCNAQSCTTCSPYMADSTTSCKTICGGDGDCWSGNYCDGTNHCVTKKNTGEICTASNECSSGYCRDDGWDGAGKFCATDATTCVHDGQNYANGWELCSGNSWYKSCGSSTWGSQNNCAAAAYCDAGGGAQSGYKAADTCSSGATAGCNAQSCTTCSPYIAGSTTSCKTTCGSDADCWSGYYCDGTNHCVTKKSAGEVCATSNECSSGYCRDDGWDGVGKFCAADAITCVHDEQNYTNGWELCSGNSWYKSCGSSTWGSQTDCASAAYCDAGGGAQSGYKPTETCSSGAAGGCNGQSCQSCAPYIAGSTTSCKTSCSSSGDCWPGYICPGTSCVDNPCDPDPCNDHGACSGGTCTCYVGFAGSGCNSCRSGFSGYPNCAAGPWYQEWSMSGEAQGGYFGQSVSYGPDADGDGLGDVLVGAPSMSSSVGAAYLYSGADGSLLQAWIGEGDGAFGESVSLGPDATGDGRADVLIAAPSVTVGSYSQAGKVYLYNGATGALVRSWSGTASYAYFGNSISLGPDTNGDGRGDVLIGMISGGTGGQAFLYSGSAGTLLRTFNGAESGARFGAAVFLGADLSGDGRGDLLVGENMATASGKTNAGKAYLYSGASGALLKTYSGENAGDRFGLSLSIGPDADGDGKPDVAIGTSLFDNGSLSNVGKAYLFSSATGSAIRSWIGPYQGSRIGIGISLGPDADGDGLGDVLIGSDNQNFAALYSSTTGQMLNLWKGASGSAFGSQLWLGPSMNGDTKPEVVIGAHSENSAQGAVRFFMSNRGTCAPDCTGKCGAASDGCGGTCNSCQGIEVCSQQFCVSDPCLVVTCNKRGTCNAGVCTCENGFSGANCETCDTGYYDYPSCNLTIFPSTGLAGVCYDASASIVCPSSGQAFYGQDGNYQPPMRFLNLSAYADNSYFDPVILDQNTGLMWPKNSSSSDGAYTYANAVTACNNMVKFGYSDWRVPSLAELHSLLDYSKPQPQVDTSLFTDFYQDSYWTSTAADTYTSGANFTIGLGSFGAIYPTARTSSKFVRCVRGDALTQQNLVNNGNGTITDNATGLMWQQTDDNTQRNWQNALSYCEGLSLATKSDWRLPSRKELWSIVDTGRINPALNPSFFTGIEPWMYFTATTYGGSAGETYGVYFGNGSPDNGCGKSSATYYVLCVRNMP